MRVNILAGGPQELVPQVLVSQRRNECWIGVDHGASQLLECGIKPAVAVGDFDSTTEDEYQRLHSQLSDIKVYPPAKDFTDTQLGIKAAIAEYGPDKIDLFGATGGRLDHLLANLYLPMQAAFADYLPKIRLIDRQNIVSYYLPGSYSIHRDPQMDYLAFVNLTPVKGLTLPDEKYPLVNWDSQIPFSWSSNRFISTVSHFSFDEGIVAVIQCRG